MSDKWKEIVGRLAPTIATALGGPLAGLGVNQLSKFLLGREDGTEEEIASVLSGGLTPDQVASLKESEKQFKLEMQRLNLKEKELHAKDRASAREMGVKAHQAPQIALTVVYQLGFFGILGSILWAAGHDSLAQVPEWVQANVALILGVLLAGVKNQMQYWFGSSSGSKEKDANAFARPTG